MTADERWMDAALRQARRALGLSSPNPAVGAVVVRDGMRVGEGHTQPPGGPHAEVMALRAAGERARGATLYVTLEPCAHHGRTPPCTEAVRHAGITRVVAAMEDPHAIVAGRGFAVLRAAGIAVDVGVREQPARAHLEAYIKHVRTGMPLGLLKCALSLDGKIATRTGDSRWVSGEAARRWVHRLRQEFDAVAVGVGTLLRDDPQLTVRLPGKRRDPLRVVFDTQARTPPDARLFAAGGPVIIATSEHAPAERVAALEARGATILRLPEMDGRVSLDAAFRELGARGVMSVLLEGGGTVAAAALAAGVIDRVLFFLAPRLVGGREAPTPVEGLGVATMAEALRLERLRVRRVGEDLAVEAHVHRDC
ncbi:MAG: bifunctional diaminohydroxyphosphoribosylaminopyrimidine deaminase/5-amino-6-(5-phosphoribosylamino)uracil reductase RibD [Armatimonadetes bacterium]|nr:bifunctional diaminohydroxyphosphoribosylaminopyrimidine deaminase/5-amino-6-(5-phosphoribosylamino)uracil reductase RibD [Armatimonadota bacterium]